MVLVFSIIFANSLKLYTKRNNQVQKPVGMKKDHFKHAWIEFLVLLDLELGR